MANEDVQPYEPYIIALAIVILAVIALQGSQPFIWLVAILIIVAAAGGGWVIAKKIKDDADEKSPATLKKAAKSTKSGKARGTLLKTSGHAKATVKTGDAKTMNDSGKYKGKIECDPKQLTDDDMNETKKPLVDKKKWALPIKSDDPALELLVKSIKTLNNPKPRANLGYRVLQPPAAAVNAFAQSAFANKRRLRGHIGETRIPLGDPRDNQPKSTNELVRKMAYTSLQANKQILPDDFQTI